MLSKTLCLVVPRLKDLAALGHLVEPRRRSRHGVQPGSVPTMELGPARVTRLKLFVIQ